MIAGMILIVILVICLIIRDETDPTIDPMDHVEKLFYFLRKDK